MYIYTSAKSHYVCTISNLDSLSALWIVLKDIEPYKPAPDMAGNSLDLRLYFS